ncbi:hypothetical protein [Klenkia brasiliensis]|uniref:Uncharacterized protein n=1 Tax=Klenkia brasiliensis TaxID=333142 RepID=A0A1G7PTR1_9ACTN|nr:hypothetical protein [Klenkia brasiliensis]SDF89593.1 hypothetical protein SAMN05660324_1212 [Klenkia brasiliensis]
MTAAAVDPLTHVLARVQHVLGAGRAAEDAAVTAVGRFLRGDEPAWLGGRTDVVRLDVLTVCELLALRRG